MRLLQYDHFHEHIERVVPDNKLAMDQAIVMQALVEYKNVRLFDLVEVVVH